MKRYDGTWQSLREKLYRPNSHSACHSGYAFEEHTPENSVKFFKILKKVFPFKIQKIQTDNGTEFTYKYISDTKICPFDEALQEAGIAHVLIPPRTPWHNGKVERSHRNDQRYFYNWEKFSDVNELNEKLKKHLYWSNRKIMRTLENKSPIEILREKLAAAQRLWRSFQNRRTLRCVNFESFYAHRKTFSFVGSYLFTSQKNAEKKFGNRLTNESVLRIVLSDGSIK